MVVPADVRDQSIFFAQSTESTDVSREASALSAINIFNDLSLKPHTRHYIFYATSFDDAERNEIVRRTIQRITGMRCFIGDDIQVTTKVSV